MKFIYATGGREKYFKAENVGDCVTRAICNATGKDYKEVYDALKNLERTMKVGKRERKGSVRDGTRKRVLEKYIEETLGWVWIPTMTIGSGCQVHLTERELPSKGNYIISVSKHLTCLKDGVLYDTYDCSKLGKRCVYGYWREPTKSELLDRAEMKKMADLEKVEIAKTRAKIEQIKLQHEPAINKLNKKIKDLQHQLVLENNRMKREIEKLKKERAKNFISSLL